jgi:hypothetical protein
LAQNYFTNKGLNLGLNWVNKEEHYDEWPSGKVEKTQDTMIKKTY